MSSRISQLQYRSIVDGFSEPTFVVTIDVDWSSDACIRNSVSWLNRAGITPTVFLTHASEAVDELKRDGLIETGIHPNFLPGSSHGATVPEVFDALERVVGDPIALRSHSYVESSHIMLEAIARGITVDSNACLFMQPYIFPVRHWTGVWRLPVFWEDDIHWRTTDSWRFDDVREVFFSPGLKIIDLHPFVQALNVPGAAFYDRQKARNGSVTEAEISELRYPGPGAHSFVLELIEAVRTAGHRFTPLSAVIDRLDTLTRVG